jgi:hypothetical protein
MRNEVFQYWMKFAIWYVPVFLVIGFYLGSLPQGDSIAAGLGVVLYLYIFLTLFFLVSLIRIISKYQSLKK